MSKRFPARIELYQSGMSDAEIARAEGIDRSSVGQWRRARGLPPRAESGHLDDGQSAARLKAYEQGKTDAEMAAMFGVNRASITRWRHRAKLRSNDNPNNALTEVQQAARMLLYSFGYSDKRIGCEQRRATNVIRRWRVRLGLPSNGAGVLAKVDHSARLMRRIKSALPKYLSPADRDDTMSDLFEAVLSGKIPIEEIERRAKRFGNRVIESYANKWGDRSLNEEMGHEGDGFTMMDTLVDERSSSWLEEMGATVW